MVLKRANFGGVAMTSQVRGVQLARFSTMRRGRWGLLPSAIRWNPHAAVADPADARMQAAIALVQVPREASRGDVGVAFDRRAIMIAAQRPADRRAPLWSPTFEHDACGVGLVVDIAGRPTSEEV